MPGPHILPVATTALAQAAEGLFEFGRAQFEELARVASAVVGWLQKRGFQIGSWRTPEDLTRVEHALLLVKQHSPLHYSRIINDLERVWIFLLSHGRADYTTDSGRPFRGDA
jgi:hypothetical protein